MHEGLQNSFEAMWNRSSRKDPVDQIPEMESQDAAFARWREKTPDPTIVEQVEARYREALGLENQAMGRMTAGGKKKGLRQAGEMYKSLLAEHPDFANAACRLAYVLEATGSFEDSIDSAAFASKADPEFEMAHFCRGIALKVLGRRDEAAAAYREAIAVNPRFAAARDNLGLILVDEGDFEGAADQFRAILRDFPGAKNAEKNLTLAEQHTTRG
jgi:tetratricopeptide (TPR) repeat protein